MQHVLLRVVVSLALLAPMCASNNYAWSQEGAAPAAKSEKPSLFKRLLIDTAVDATVNAAESAARRNASRSSAKPTPTTKPAGAKCLEIKLDRELKSVVVKESPPIRLARGTQKTMEDIVRVKHSVTISKGWHAEAEVRAKAEAAWASLEASVRGGIERSTSKTYGTETERKRSVTLQGDGVSAVKVLWVEYFRTGMATLAVDGQTLEVPFEFREDFDLLTTEAGAAGELVRTWSDVTGQYAVQATLVDVKDGHVRLRKNDERIVAVPLEVLSDADRRYATDKIHAADQATP
jgi:hypothetical protein